VALKNKRKFVMAELKESYFRQACLNLAHAENDGQAELNLGIDTLAEQEVDP
jgi:hypothetical protein